MAASGEVIYVEFLSTAIATGTSIYFGAEGWPAVPAKASAVERCVEQSAETIEQAWRDRVMLNKIAEEIAACHRHAAECRVKAEQTEDPDMQRDLLALERSWLFLASSYELSEQSEDFTDGVERRKKD